jgi:hypothetical protein
LRLIIFGQVREFPKAAVYAVSAAALFFIYSVFYSPLIRQIKQKRAEYKTIVAKLQQARNSITSVARGNAPGSQIQASGVLQLKGVFLDQETPMALINDEVVSVGDKIGGSVVSAIKEDRVVLNDGKRDFQLLLEQ